ncbi:MAG: methyltransferase domain-containing protein [Phycisphaerales bacterium]
MPISTSPAAPTLTGPPVMIDGRTSADFYGAIYADAAGDPNAVPWSHGGAHPALVRWLDVVAPQLVRCGARVAVPACGYGEEVRALIGRGYDAIGFDVSPLAVRGARSLDPANDGQYVEADLFDLPSRWRHRFDLVVEVNTVQAMPPTARDRIMAAMAELLTPHGHLLAVGHARPEGTPLDSARAVPPWPLTASELEAVAGRAGLVPDTPIDIFELERAAAPAVPAAVPGHPSATAIPNAVATAAVATAIDPAGRPALRFRGLFRRG